MKLTNEHRQSIIKACIKATFSKRDDVVKALQIKLGDAMYEHLHGATAKIADKLPDGWCSTQGTIRITMAGFSHHAAGKHRDNIPLSKHRRFPTFGNHQLTINPDHPLHDQADALLDEYLALESAKAELEGSLRGVVYGVNTLAKLQEAWPEGEKYFPVEQAKKTAVVPYELAAQVNKIMGLKPARKGK